MRASFLPKLFLPLAIAGLAGCAKSADTIEVVREDDPAVIAALAEPITLDPDLAGMNRAGGALALPPQDGSLPSIDIGPEVIAAARAEAVALVGGPGQMRQAPEPGEVAGSLPAVARLTAAALAAATPGARAACAEQARYTMLWAALMPEAFPVYPGGAVQEAAGIDGPGCALRSIRFVTPVPPGEVIDFYFTRARAAGYAAERVLQDGDDRLAGQRGGASFTLYVRRLPTGNTEVDLVTAGQG